MVVVFIGNVLVLAGHVVVLAVLQATDHSVWWAAAFSALCAGAIGLGWIYHLSMEQDDISGEDTLWTAVFAIFFPAGSLPIAVFGLNAMTEDLEEASDVSMMLAASPLPVVVFYLTALFAPFFEGTEFVSSVLWALVALGLQLAPLAGEVGAREEPDVPQFHKMAA
jgi:hypothetical protein